MEDIIIEKLEYGFNVKQGDKYSENISYEEMLGLVSALCLGDATKTSLQSWMQTAEEHQRRRASYHQSISE